MHIDLVFPPVHDPAMPHSALPLLKGYLERETSHTAQCHDVNLAFFAGSVFAGRNNEIVSGFRSQLAASGSVGEGVNIALAFDQTLREEFLRWEGEAPGFRISLRNFGAPFDRRDPAAVRAFAESSETPFDSTFAPISAVLGEIVGINLSVEDQILPAVRLVRMIREARKDATIIWGGSFLSRIYSILGQELPDYWDFLILREGEEPLVELLNALEAGTTPSDERIVARRGGAIQGASILVPFSTQVVTNINRTGNPNFEDYSVLSYLSLDPMLPVLASRKCYWGRCRFCTIHESWDPRARKRDADSVAAELSNLKSRHGISSFRFVDEAVPPDLLADLIPRLRDLQVDFEIYAIAERRFLDARFVGALGAAGCRQAYFGLESADAGALEGMGKKINQQRHYSRLFGGCAAAGIHVYVYTLFGYPDIPAEAEDDTISFILHEGSVQTATIASFVPVVGSPFAAQQADHLIHSGQMTEDFEVFVDDRGGARAVVSMGRAAAERAIHTVYVQRPDLALTSLLNDEMRFSLSKRFGASFAVDALASGELHDQHFVVAAMDQMRRERVDRRIE